MSVKHLGIRLSKASRTREGVLRAREELIGDEVNAPCRPLPRPAHAARYRPRDRRRDFANDRELLMRQRGSSATESFSRDKGKRTLSSSATTSTCCSISGERTREGFASNREPLLGQKRTLSSSSTTSTCCSISAETTLLPPTFTSMGCVRIRRARASICEKRKGGGGGGEGVRCICGWV